MGDNSKRVKIQWIFLSLLQNQKVNFNQTWYKWFLGKGNLKLYKSRARSSFKRILSQNAKREWGYIKSSQEPQSQ
jgi:hypothetical protein